MLQATPFSVHSEAKLKSFLFSRLQFWDRWPRGRRRTARCVVISLPRCNNLPRFIDTNVDIVVVTTHVAVWDFHAVGPQPHPTNPFWCRGESDASMLPQRSGTSHLQVRTKEESRVNLLIEPHVKY